MENWIASEFAGIDFNDKRLTKRSYKILNTLGYAPGRTIPQAFQTWKDIKACYRFFDNPSVNESKILAPHIKKTRERIKNEPVVLLPTDTSALDYSSKKAMQGKSPISETREGIFLQASLAVTPDRLCIGIVDAKLWRRGIDYPSNKDKHRDDKTIEEKESFRWLEGYKNACEIAKESTNSQIIYITDREADIVELLQESIKQKSEGGADVIIRAQHNRQLTEKDPNGTINKPYKKLIETLKSADSLGEINFTIPASHGRKARGVKQQIKAKELTFRTKKYDGSSVRKFTINVVMATETDSCGQEEALSWIFLTTLPINTFENAYKVIEYYLCRWEIEVFFKVLKSGCQVEERQLETTDRMKPLIALFLVLSWRIMYVMMLGRHCPDIACEAIFSDSEWKSVFKILHKKEKIPEKSISLNEFILMIAELGGYIKRNNQSPGIKVMWKGLMRMYDFAIAWESFGQSCG